jgi:hypothetical protein
MCYTSLILYSGGEDKRIASLRSAWTTNETLSHKQNKTKQIIAAIYWLGCGSSGRLLAKQEQGTEY